MKEEMYEKNEMKNLKEYIYTCCNGTGSKSQTDQKKFNDFSRKEFFFFKSPHEMFYFEVGNKTIPPHLAIHCKVMKIFKKFINITNSSFIIFIFKFKRNFFL